MVEAVKSGSLKVLGGNLGAVQKILSSGYASEGSHYPTLEALFGSLGDEIVATSLPSYIECSAPDYIVIKDLATIGYKESNRISSYTYHQSCQEAMIAAITSRTNRILVGNHLISVWQGAGLLFPSMATGIIRIIKQSLIAKKRHARPRYAGDRKHVKARARTNMRG